MSVLRKKLGDEARRPRYIETVRGVGFRLVG
jgi:DNA-binding response OmpR family regulator